MLSLLLTLALRLPLHVQQQNAHNNNVKLQVAAEAVVANPLALAKAADEARGLAIDSISKAKSGHMGLPLGCAEIGAVLFGQVQTLTTHAQ